MKKLNKKGFTIVELVIVIAVIAILAGVLIPTFATVVNRANESAAMQQAKNAYENYLAEYADKKDVMNDFYIEVKGANTYYFYVDSNGQFNSTAVARPNSGNYVSLDKKATTFPTTSDATSTAIAVSTFGS